MTEVQFLGAAQTVTGSMHLVRTPRATVLLDCGLFQGRRMEAMERNRTLPIDADGLDAVVLSHAHIDHSGALPVLFKHGARAPIYTTAATRDLCSAMLLDAALIQQADARYINKVIERDHAPMRPVEPLYVPEDVPRTMERFRALPYGQVKAIAPGVRLTLFDAGHVLGSAVTVLDCEDDGTRIVFTGDLGRPGMPILRTPEVPPRADLLIMESTYGDRRHPPVEQMDGEIERVVREAFERKGKVIIPSFALERAQEVLYALKRIEQAGRLPDIPIYVDSPLTVKVTDVFRRHPECYGPDLAAMIGSGQSPFDLRRLKYVSDVEESKAITSAPGPAIVIAASGMCEGGRIVHHLKATVEDERHTVLIVGFQAQHTLGRRIVERQPRIKIFGVERDLRAHVVVLEGMSAHADQRDLVDFAERVRQSGRLQAVALVHGEPVAQRALQKALEARAFPSVHVPARGDRLSLATATRQGPVVLRHDACIA